MSCHKTASLLLAFGLAFAAPAALALDSGDIVITSLAGDVRIIVDGAPRTLKAGAALEPPATIQTGSNGTVELRQGETTVSIGPDTKLEFPALASKGGPIDRIVQSRGNAFYRIGKRGGRQMRVETPVLVGCIKGTQFNVAVQDYSSTISLFEGRLEVHASDETDVVDLLAGEVASRKAGDVSIGVLRMDARPAIVPTRPTPAGSHVASAPDPDLVAHADPIAGIPVPGADRAIGAAAREVAVSVPPSPMPVVETPVTTVTAPDAGTPVSAPEVSVPVTVPVSVPMTPEVGLVDQVKNDDVALGLDDGNNGHGNDSDHDDASNPGNSHGKGPSPGRDADTVLDDATRHRK